MMTAEDCLRAAWAALLRGDLEERDRMCRLAENVMKVGERIEAGYPATEAIVTSAPVCLPDQTKLLS